MMGINRPVILVLVDHYLPGYKGGGPIRSIANMVEHFEDDFCFKIITRDRDLGDCEAYPGIQNDSWQIIGKNQVYYLSPGMNSLKKITKLLNETKYDILYLNSFFSPLFTIAPLILQKMGIIKLKKVIVAPRGEFSRGAIQIKQGKKYCYLKLASYIKLYDNVFWQASSQFELADIKRVIKKIDEDTSVFIARNLLPQNIYQNELPIRQKKQAGNLQAVFIARISRKKNLDGALRILRDIKGNVQFNIYGPKEDTTYWNECQQIIDSLPLNINAQYCGSIEHDKVYQVFRESDVLFFPTLGENFGHVIAESFKGGCPVVISDQTPWRDLEKSEIGYDLPLNQPELFRKALQNYVDMDDCTYSAVRNRIAEYQNKMIDDDEIISMNRNMFLGVLNKN